MEDDTTSWWKETMWDMQPSEDVKVFQEGTHSHAKHEDGEPFQEKPHSVIGNEAIEAFDER